ncbi:50S ribosomal protein L35 [Candidatus Shapirobacteria bacterium CG03_land_8_20_14_0_80_39_12]|uniref:Large ribosomal subunit protein bL35 n=1 Tax=Candidatus Shapirobacteria bacterium CG03_land_8_20_14_0_80_39_12 TaxID=1974879 RepID=A0A2M7BBG3_9BACT|nr:MAG: 50S ribosomal protein L35 [Candidatus Shapirobacteria bacterium CG03_land_8_20_14_0_80_39_12]
MKQKMKIPKSVLRRVKVSGSGKITHASNYNRHLARNKSQSQKRRLSGTKEFSNAFTNKVRKALGIKNES